MDTDARDNLPKFDVGTKKPPISSSNALWLLQNLLQPQTTGFDQVNLDLSFTNLTNWDIQRVVNLSFIINFCRLYNLPKSLYISNGEYATFLNAKRSVDGWSGQLLTTTVTKAQQEYTDMSHKKTGWKLFSFKKKEE